MSRFLLVPLVCVLLLPCSFSAQESERQDVAKSPDESKIRERLESYLQAFNSHDAVAIGAFWSQDGVSLGEDSGERITGRESLVRHFSEFFRDMPTARLSGEISELRLIRPDVALIDGRTTLLVDETGAVVSSYSAILVKNGDDWFISNLRQRDVAPPSSPEALRELDWLVGTWLDESEEARVSTTIRWSRNEAFLIRSFTVQYPDADLMEGTQVIGWDPLNSQIRTWTFNSDGSFGQGTASKHDNDWLLKMWQILSDGQIATATQVISRVDQDRMTVQFIGETINGEPVPSSKVVTVVRVPAAAEEVSDAPVSEQKGQP